MEFIKKALFAYYCCEALLCAYIITAALLFSYEHVFGAVPAGMPWIFVVIALGFALRLFYRKMLHFNARADNFILISRRDMIVAVVTVLVALGIFATLAWGWLKLYPTLF